MEAAATGEAPAPPHHSCRACLLSAFIIDNDPKKISRAASEAVATQPVPSPHTTMAPSRTRTVKNKHAAGKTDSSGKGRGAKHSSSDGVSKSKKPKGPATATQVKEKSRALLAKRPKKKTYTATELGIPELNMVTPVGVVKPKGKKKGKVFVDDQVCAFSFRNKKARMGSNK